MKTLSLATIAAAFVLLGLAAPAARAQTIPPPSCSVSAQSRPYGAQQLVYASGTCVSHGPDGGQFPGQFAVIVSYPGGGSLSYGWESGKGGGGYSDFWFLPASGPGGGSGTATYTVYLCPTALLGPGCASASGTFQVQ